MPNNPPSWSRATNAETISLLAFFSTLDLSRTLRERKAREPWKVPHEHLHAFLEEQVRQAMTCFHELPIYGPAFERLVQYRVSLVDLQSVHWAVSLEGQVTPSNGLYFADDPYLSGKQQEAATTTSETEIFWQALAVSPDLTDQLRRLDERGPNRVCQHAQRMRAFLLSYVSIAARHLVAPLFVPQFLLRSAQGIDWHDIAERLSGKTILVPCRCDSVALPETYPGVQTLLFEGVLQLARAEIAQVAQCLPDSSQVLARANAELLSADANTVLPHTNNTHEIIR